MTCTCSNTYKTLFFTDTGPYQSTISVNPSYSELFSSTCSIKTSPDRAVVSICSDAGSSQSTCTCNIQLLQFIFVMGETLNFGVRQIADYRYLISRGMVMWAVYTSAGTKVLPSSAYDIQSFHSPIDHALNCIAFVCSQNTPDPVCILRITCMHLLLTLL